MAPRSFAATALLGMLLGACTYIPAETEPSSTLGAPPSTLPAELAATPAVPEDLPDPLADVRLELSELSFGFDDPVVVSGRSDTDDLYVGTREGRVWRVRVTFNRSGRRSTQRLSTPLIDLRPYLEEDGPLVDDLISGELVDFIFSPDGRTMYISTTGPRGELRVESYPVGTSTRMDRSLRRTMFTVDDISAGRSGGGLAFGPDGFLYVGLGDGGADEIAGDGPEIVAGSIVRLDADVDAEGPAYAVPQGNPDVDDSDIAPEVWIRGVASPDVVRIDRGNGSLWVGGDLTGDGPELTAITEALNRGRGSNMSEINELGWTPVIETEGDCSVAGLVPYSGSEIPELTGSTIWATRCDNAPRTLAVDGPTLLAERSHDGEAEIEEGTISGMGTDRHGEPLIVTSAGRLYQVTRGEFPDPEEDIDDDE